MHDPDHHKTIANLIHLVGGKDECLRLGFLGQDDNQTLILSPLGLGYLIDVVAGDVESLAESYALGFAQASSQTE